jgi:Protein of unknown function (DUF3325)
MIELLALALSYAGFVALALSMDRHHRQVWGRVPSGRMRLALRLAGAAGLASALAACVAHAGGSVGPVLWFGLLSAAGLVVVLLLALRPRAVVVLAVTATLLAGAIGGYAMATNDASGAIGKALGVTAIQGRV